MNNDLISRSELKKAFNKWWGCDDIPATVVEDLIDNAPTVEPKKEVVPVCKVTFDKEQLQEIVDKKVAEMIERPQGEWVRKEDIMHYIAAQYSEHNELVPIWLSIGDFNVTDGNSR